VSTWCRVLGDVSGFSTLTRNCALSLRCKSLKLKEVDCSDAQRALGFDQFLSHLSEAQQKWFETDVRLVHLTRVYDNPELIRTS